MTILNPNDGGGRDTPGAGAYHSHMPMCERGRGCPGAACRARENARKARKAAANKTRRSAQPDSTRRQDRLHSQAYRDRQKAKTLEATLEATNHQAIMPEVVFACKEPGAGQQPCEPRRDDSLSAREVWVEHCINGQIKRATYAAERAWNERALEAKGRAAFRLAVEKDPRRLRSCVQDLGTQVVRTWMAEWLLSLAHGGALLKRKSVVAVCRLQRPLSFRFLEIMESDGVIMESDRIIDKWVAIEYLRGAYDGWRKIVARRRRRSERGVAACQHPLSFRWMEIMESEGAIMESDRIIWKLVGDESVRGACGGWREIVARRRRRQQASDIGKQVDKEYLRRAWKDWEDKVFRPMLARQRERDASGLSRIAKVVLASERKSAARKLSSFPTFVPRKGSGDCLPQVSPLCGLKEFFTGVLLPSENRGQSPVSGTSSDEEEEESGLKSGGFGFKCRKRQRLQPEQQLAMRNPVRFGSKPQPSDGFSFMRKRPQKQGEMKKRPNAHNGNPAAAPPSPQGPVVRAWPSGAAEAQGCDSGLEIVNATPSPALRQDCQSHLSWWLKTSLPINHTDILVPETPSPSPLPTPAGTPAQQGEGDP